MQSVTLAHKLGTTTHLSCLRMSARREGLLTEKDLIDEAVARGCFHFMEQPGHSPVQRVSEDLFSNEQLALALLTIANPYEPWLIRVGAMLLSHPGNDVRKLALYTKYERSEVIVREIALAGRRYEPENPFWSGLLALLPETAPPKSGVLPHHSRHVSIPGLIGPKKIGPTTWLRPVKIAALGYAA
ncbi:MAG: hypothetical protein ACO1TE_27920 [Prosthecobacter sp.]